MIGAVLKNANGSSAAKPKVSGKEATKQFLLDRICEQRKIRNDAWRLYDLEDEKLEWLCSEYSRIVLGFHEGQIITDARRCYEIASIKGEHLRDGRIFCRVEAHRVLDNGGKSKQRYRIDIFVAHPYSGNEQWRLIEKPNENT